MPLFSSLNVLTSHLKAVIKWNTLKTSVSAAVIKGWMDWRQMEHEVNLKVHQPYLLYCTTTSVRALNFLTQDLFFPHQKKNKNMLKKKESTSTKSTQILPALCQVTFIYIEHLKKQQELTRSAGYSRGYVSRPKSGKNGGKGSPWIMSLG